MATTTTKKDDKKSTTPKVKYPTMQDYLGRKASLDQRSNSESGGGVGYGDYQALEAMYERVLEGQRQASINQGIKDGVIAPGPNAPGSGTVTPKPTPKPTKPTKTPQQLEDERLGRVGKARTWYENQLLDDINDAFRSSNVNTSDYQTYIDEALKEAYTGIKGAGKFEKADDYRSFLNDDIGETVLSGIRTDKQKDFTDELNSLYGSNYATNTFADSMDDSILNSILNPQYDNAVAAITRAFNRGTLSQGGYDAAIKDLEGQRTSGMSSLQTTGGGVLQGYRDDIGDIISGGLDSAGKWNFGGNWNTKDTTGLVDRTVSDLTGRLEGDIRNAVGDEQYFNWSDLIQRGGSAQGIYNPATSGDGSASSLFGAIKDRTVDENTKRGLGTQGTF